MAPPSTKTPLPDRSGRQQESAIAAAGARQAQLCIDERKAACNAAQSVPPRANELPSPRHALPKVQEQSLGWEPFPAGCYPTADRLASARSRMRAVLCLGFSVGRLR
jgi:hypothetical protein